MQYCKCHSVLTLKQGFNALVDELKEFIVEPSRDEASDVVYCLNRIAGTFLGVPYVKILPTDNLHKEKVKDRLKRYNCIRSERHLVMGYCPSFLSPEKRYIEINLERVVKTHNLPPNSYRFPNVGIRFPGAPSGIYEMDDQARMTLIVHH